MALNIPWLDQQIAQGNQNVLQSVSAPIYVPPPGMDTNVLQGLNGPSLSPQDVRAATPEIPRSRQSVLDVLGGVSDVLARVGGAEALYQPTLDARADRARMVDLDALKKRQMEQQIQTGDAELQNMDLSRLGASLRGLQSVQRSGGDIAAAWPILAKQAGIPEDRAQALGEIFSTNPQALGGLATMLGQEREFGLQPFYAQGSDGKLQAYQIGKDGTIQPITLPEGAEPIDPIKFIDTGGTQTAYGTRSGAVRRILPKQEAPGRGADRASRERIAAAGNASRERIATQKTDAGKGNTEGMQTQAAGLLGELRGLYDDLHQMGALVDPNQGTMTNIGARVRASGAGQLLEGAVGTEAQTKRDRIAAIRPSLMQSLAKATGMTGRQLDSNADVKLFMQTVTDPTKSYQANMDAINGLERFLASNTKKPAAAPQKTAGGGGKPSVSNW